MASTLRIVMAQLNTLVGDIEGNAEQVIAAARRARDEMQADAIVFPELTLSGYPPEDLLLRSGLHNRVLQALEQVNQEVSGIDVVLGYPHAASHGLYNAASLLRDGHTVATYHKHHLPNYSVFLCRRQRVLRRRDQRGQGRADHLRGYVAPRAGGVGRRGGGAAYPQPQCLTLPYRQGAGA